MLKIQIAKDFKPRIIQNDRGNWQYGKLDERTCAYSFIGFGGENVITVHLMYLQNGRADILVVHNVVDNYIATAKRLSEPWVTEEEIDDLINELIAEVSDYPEVLAA